MELVANEILTPRGAAKTVRDKTDQRRDTALRELFAALEPPRLEALDRIWDLCADDLYGLALWRTGSAEDAEDVVQEVFVRLAGAGRKLRRVRRPFGYLLTMTHRAAVDVVRRRRPAEDLEAAADLMVTAPESERPDAARAAAHLAQLPPKLREAVYLRHFADLTFRDVGAVTGVPTFTAASRYRLAINRLRQRMGVEP